MVLLVPELLTGPIRSTPRAAPVASSAEEPPLRSYTINLADDAHSRSTAPPPSGPQQPTPLGAAAAPGAGGAAQPAAAEPAPPGAASPARTAPQAVPAAPPPELPARRDRKSVVEGKRVDLGGRRISKKKKKKP